VSEPLQDRRQLEGGNVADTAHVFWVRRFTLEEHEAGDTAGWWLDAGWFRRDGGLVWAWFRREVDDGEA